MSANTLQPFKIGPTSFPKGHRPTEVVIIGAGLSKTFGLPLANELLEFMVTWHRRRPTANKLDFIFDFIEDFYPTFDRGRKWFPQAEDVLGMLDVAETYIKLRSRGRGYPWRPGKVQDVRSRFIRMLGEYLWSFQELTKSGGYLHSLRKFVRKIGTRVVYVTFNYDLLLETALSLENIPYAYALHFKSDYVSVLKPHGSINWFPTAKNKKFPKWGQWVPLGSNVIACRTLDPNDLKFKNWWESVLIPPSPSKQVQLFELKKSWTSFSSAINTTPELLIIGYSLPSADRLARLVLRRAGPKHSDCKRITIIDPAKVEKTYIDYVSPRCKWIPMRFEDWIIS